MRTAATALAGLLAALAVQGAPTRLTHSAGHVARQAGSGAAFSFTCKDDKTWVDQTGTEQKCQGDSVCNPAALAAPCEFPQGYGGADSIAAVAAGSGAATTAAGSPSALLGASSSPSSPLAAAGASTAAGSPSVPLGASSAPSSPLAAAGGSGGAVTKPVSAASSAPAGPGGVTGVTGVGGGESVPNPTGPAATNAGSVGGGSQASATAGSSAGNSTAKSDSTSTSGSSTASSNSGGPNFVAYWDNFVNFGGVSATQLTGVTHLILSFVDLSTWTTEGGVWLESTNGNFDASQISATRAMKSDMKILAALGGWGYKDQFVEAAEGTNGASIQDFGAKSAAFVKQYELDGLDLDWEFPEPQHKEKFVELCKEIKTQMGEDKVLTVAIGAKVDGDSTDAAVFTSDVFSALEGVVDMWNIMTYDYMNRYDTVTKHQSGGGVVKLAMEHYEAQGIDPKKCNIGFMNDAKYFTIPSGCSEPIGCAAPGREFWETDGADNGKSGWLRYNPEVDTTLGDNMTAIMTPMRASFATAPQDGSTAFPEEKAQAWFDTATNVFWSWTSPQDNADICEEWKSKVGGMMIWSLNQDVNGPAGGPYTEAIAKCVTGGSSGTSGGSSAGSGSSSAVAGAGSATNSAATGAGSATGATVGAGSATVAASGAGAGSATSAGAGAGSATGAPTGAGVGSATSAGAGAGSATGSATGAGAETATGAAK